MNLQHKIKVTDLISLQREKQRLQAICELKRTKLETELEYLKKNYPEVALKAFLPFDDRTNDRIFKGVKWVNDTVGAVVTPHSRLGSFFSGKGSNLLQAGLIYLGVRIVRNFLLKRK